MSRDKQIEEMAKVIHKGELDRNKGVLDCTEFTTDLVVKVGSQRLAGAKALYNEGYRKESDIALKIIGDIETLANNHTKGISMLVPQNDFLNGGKQAFDIVLRFLAELKKKYTEREKDK